MYRKLIRSVLAGATTIGVALTLAVPAAAAPIPPPAAASPEMFAALQRDLGLSAEAAQVRLAAEAEASQLEPQLRAELGDVYAGAWLTSTAGRLVVAVTDPAQVATVRAAGAVPRLVERSASELDAARMRLDRRADAAPALVTGWHVDAATNQLVVTAHPAAAGDAAGFAAATGVAADAVQVEVSTATPRPMVDVRGGDAYFPGNSRCSIGFSVVGGFVTAGHCGGAGTSTRGFNQQAQGTVQGSVFPTRDYGWVRVNANWTPQPLVNRYPGTVTVAGGQEAPVGSSVCRSGSTTGWHCGTITNKNATVNYPQGTVFGLTRTTACAEPGDSGGSWLTGQQAQGVTSGGSGNCTTGGIIFFQPLQPILSAFGLTLVDRKSVV